MSEAREELLAKVMAHVVANGLADASLRELATAAGTSHRMLIYHFGSREGLVAAIVAAMEGQQRAALAAIAASAASPAEVIRAQWAQLSDPALAPFVRLFFEICGQALHRRPGTEGFLASLTAPWIEAAAAAARAVGFEPDDVDARLGIAAVRGLLLDAVASGNIAGPTASLERLLGYWEAARS
ncbi:MAG: TetR family transcriptional regulator [Dehalococcoidia bacterium]